MIIDIPLSAPTNRTELLGNCYQRPRGAAANVNVMGYFHDCHFYLIIQDQRAPWRISAIHNKEKGRQHCTNICKQHLKMPRSVNTVTD